MIPLLALVLGCSPELTREELLDPAACQSCHPDHYREWSGSMHAYAAEDPVFRAMNALGQEQTGGALGDFCVDCHAPVAVREGLTEDGMNLDDVPEALQGVTCAYCHQIDAVTGTHNNALSWANDGVLRGGLSSPVSNGGAHEMAYSPLHDRTRAASSDLCGACHDVVTPAGIHLERSYLEWQESLYALPEPGMQQTCSQCHMQGRDGLAADYEGVPLRRVHSHTFAGVDTALTPFPETEAQAEEVGRLLDHSLAASVCVVPAEGGARVDVVLENLAAGHMFPSGAAHDRRVWAEVQAWRGDEVVLTSGTVPEGTPLTEVQAKDPTLWRLGDRLFDDAGKEVHHFWEARTVESQLLHPPTRLDPTDPAWVDTHVYRSWNLEGEPPTKVALKVHLRALGLDLLDDLIARGHLNPAIRDAVPTWTLASTVVEWTGPLGSCNPPLEAR